jgi:hypothetical protein
MKNKTFTFELKDLNISVSQIEEFMGYKDGEDSAMIKDLIVEVLEEAAGICNIRAQYTIFDDVQFNTEKKSVKISNVDFEIGRIIYNHIQKSDSAALFLCTAGEEIGKRSKELMQESDMLKGYVYDVVGSEIVDTAAGRMWLLLEKEMKAEGLKVTNGYSPGHCGWDVAEQHKLFNLVPGDFCKIRLTESALMDPVKSVSGVIGIGENVKYYPYVCDLCSLKDCFYREIKKKKVISL